MKKLINAVDDVLTESLAGFGRAHANLVEVSTDPKLVTRKGGGKKGKVALISGGGSGHEPMHAGFVGMGMLDAACPGEVSTSPTPDQMLAAAEAVDGGAGVLWIVKNYAGDVMNFEMAGEMYDGPTETVLTNDDVAVESSLHSQGRRGVAATVIVEKIVGAAAERGDDLAACKALGDRVNEASGTMGIALTSCTVPAAGTPTFTIGEGEMELGVGIHGEPGRKRVELMKADEIAEALIAAICESIAPSGDDDLLLLVNGMGGTPLLELYLLYNSALQVVEERGLKIARSLVGNYCTSLEMAGASITLTKLDKETMELWDAPVHTAALRWKA
ncbi:dihydroxyacetone kinase-like protein [Rhodobium orientis]|uniref:phosphoenolpyruvate--glycerone phosphotransferase n=1 Tax=Rhodobium orientis TaxID=34017 RepID=A0A327JQ79_9HYPH|nr:dihydroxyacetone kinase subunit DhaK [Rhodobium orientis]MBB4305348.1 dihydroxyacetone kinase-like protein [Rhodobium orientis]MBK5949943.1 dihydroxyacetone kinase subunit DhaK [Rhodobium orientis]RAI25558.1 dihydroxyacetone kinase subunit DhaK [Rhodobium orientis]